MCHCPQETNEQIGFTSTMEIDRGLTSMELQQESEIIVHDCDNSDKYDNNKDMLLKEAVVGHRITSITFILMTLMTLTTTWHP
jgi:hypothetical protein